MRAERFSGGAIGEPGHRVFMLEVVSAGDATAYVIEKLQVAVLAEEAQSLLRTRGLIGSGAALDPGEVHAETPIEYRVGGLQLAVDDEAGLAIVVIHSTEEQDSPARYELTLPQLDAFAREALAVVAAGRPACPRCGLAMDPDGHICPRSNGDLREYRP